MEGSQKGKIHVPSSQNMASAKPPMGPSSPFQVRHKTTLGDAAGVENPPTSGATTIDDSTAKPDQAEAAKADLGFNYDPNMDPKKLRRIMSNRLSAQRSRLKKLQYLANLELQAKAYEAQIANLQPQVASYQNQKHSLLLENETLDHQMATLRQETFLRDAEIEKNKVEVNMLRELHNMQQEQLQAQMLNWSTNLQPAMSNEYPISNYYSNPYQVAPTQSQKWIPAVPGEHESNLTLRNNMESMETNDHTSQNAPNPNLDHHFP